MTLLLVGVRPGSVSACAMGFSFQFEPLPDHFGREEKALEPFLDRTFARRGWVWASPPLTIFAPAHPENSARISIGVGATSPDLIGVYERFSIFKISLVTQIEFVSEKEVARRLPRRIDLERAAGAGPFGGKTSQIERGIEKIAEFNLSELTPPFAKLRIRSTGETGIKLFASFVPGDKKAPVQIVRGATVIKVISGNPCNRTLYVYGKWPKNLRKSYRYE